jgi:RNA polymerase sigma-70 factor, ECF subfamily
MTFNHESTSTLYPYTSDRLSIELLVHHYAEAIHSFATTILHDQHEAQDATQETLITAVRSMHRYQGDSSLKTWLFGITLNVCRRHLRRRQSKQMLLSVLQTLHLTTPSIPDPEGAAIRAESDQALWAAVESLGEKYRLPLILRYVHAMSIREIAVVVSVPEGTIHQRMHYARRLLHARLAEQQEI